jgi:hypothetical protein
MIVLDEHLEEPFLRDQLATWYGGSVIKAHGSSTENDIKDDAVPSLLRTIHAPTFLTINVRDFWRKIEADRRFGVICVEMNDRRKKEIPSLLRGLFALEPFKTRGSRLGKVILVAPTAVFYYRDSSKGITRLDW